MVIMAGGIARGRIRTTTATTESHNMVAKHQYMLAETCSLRLPCTCLDIHVILNRPRSIYQYSSMAPRLAGQNCKFFNLLLSLNSQKRLGYKENNTKYRILTRKPRSHVRILIYRTWPIDTCQFKVSTDQYHVPLSRAQVKSSSRSRVFLTELTADQVLGFRLDSGLMSG